MVIGRLDILSRIERGRLIKPSAILRFVLNVVPGHLITNRDGRNYVIPAWSANNSNLVCIRLTDVPVWKVVPEHLTSITEEKINDIVFDLNVYINSLGADRVSGDGLWNVSVWASADANGGKETDRISYTEQVNE